MVKRLPPIGGRDGSSKLPRCTMNVIYARESITPAIFLAGPTPRDPKTESWRPEALKILELHDFEGIVYVPENRVYTDGYEYDAQVNWEWLALEMSTAIVFWVPRELNKMPAMTTNVEFGHYVKDGRVVLGYPKDAPKMKYLHALADRYSVPVFHDLERTIIAAIDMA
jgi:hypothetical protein